MDARETAFAIPVSVVLLVSLAVVAASAQEPFNIVTVAGTIYDLRRDNQPATQASIVPNPGVAVDNEGSLFFSDAGGIPRIRKVTSPDGILTTVAGTGAVGGAAGARAAAADQPAAVLRRAGRAIGVAVPYRCA